MQVRLMFFLRSPPKTSEVTSKITEHITHIHLSLHCPPVCHTIEPSPAAVSHHMTNINTCHQQRSQLEKETLTVLALFSGLLPLLYSVCVYIYRADDAAMN